MKKLACLFLSAVLLGSVAFGITSCSEDATPIITTQAVSYDDLKNKVDVFDSVYSNYCYNNQEELKVTSGEGYSPLGSPCSYTYITNIEGTNKADTVRSCTLEVTHDDGSICVDEYYAVDSITLFIARTTVPSDGSVGTVTKYIIANNVCYEIDEANAMLKPIEKPDTLDLYLSFSEIVELYGTAQ